jgi:hypothetical protein
MHRTRHAACLVALVGLAAVAPAMAQDSKDRTVEQYKCRDVMREHGASRDNAIAFLHGYLLGKSGGQSFNLDTLHKQTQAFMELCLSNPDSKAVDQMAAVRK